MWAGTIEIPGQPKLTGSIMVVSKVKASASLGEMDI